jgi:hypothetical protein
MDKRRFLTTLLTAPFLLNVMKPTFANASADKLNFANNLADQKEKPPALAPDLVKDFVRAGHSDLQKVKDMLGQTPGLLNASWDWGGGDFETALEGAGHMGNRDIAEYLLSRGARINIFAAAMLGKIEIVKSTLTAFPDLKTSKGPHGIMLLQHATKGGEPAKEVLTYLQEIGAT